MQQRLLQQADRQPWPSGTGKAIAVLRLGPEELTARYSLRFVEDYDNLDYYVASGVRLPSGRRVVLLRHRGNPDPGTVVEADSRDNSSEARRELLDALGLAEEAFAWTPE